VLERIVFKTLFLNFLMPPKPKEISSKDKRLELVKQVSSVTGKNTAPIIEILFDKENVNEFLIAKKLDMTINQIRNVLYKLSDHGLVSFVRKKDKKKGWYTYFWTFDSEKSFALLKKIIEKEIDQLKQELRSRETKQFYKSPGVNIEYTEEKALEYDFICPETGEVMELKDNSQEIKNLNSQIMRMQKSFEEIDEELEFLKEKREKSMERKRNKEEKKKKKERAEKTAKTKARKAADKKIADKLDKKKTAKKKITKKATKKKTVKKVVKKKTKKAKKKLSKK
jgi:transcription initiation factor TFIIE subunit alpha